MQDDNRGLGQGLKDNKRTANRFRLLLERRSSSEKVSSDWTGIQMNKTKVRLRLFRLLKQEETVKHVNQPIMQIKIVLDIFVIIISGKNN